MSVLWEASQDVKPPRTCFLNFPPGCPAGKPHEAQQQREILRAALKMAPEFKSDAWHMQTLPFEWDGQQGSGEWEKEVYELYRNGGIATVVAHQKEHRLQGDAIQGREREFTIRCNC